MEPAVWGMLGVLVVGAIVVWIGWRRDRRHNARQAEQASQPPRPLPGVADDAQPEYVQQTDLLALRPPLPGEDSTGGSGEIPTLLERRSDTASIPGGAPSAFLNLREQSMAALNRPAVLVTDADLTTDRDVTTLLLAATQRGDSLVIVAAGFSPVALGTLHANAVTGKLPNLPIALPEARDRRRATALTGGRLVSAADLAAGWLPDEAWGNCEAWIADLDNSWIITSVNSKQSE